MKENEKSVSAIKKGYDDEDYSYVDYWFGRNYEHQSEIIALEKLLPPHIISVADIGGGFGRLSQFLALRSKTVYLIEPSSKNRASAKTFLKSIHNVKILAGAADKTGLPDQSVEVVVIVRVLHHLPDITPALNEIFRILKPNGLLVMEFANSTHFKSRIKSFLTNSPIPLTPLDRRSPANIKRDTIPFVNHHPKTILQQLISQGFKPFQTLSVSNFRSTIIVNKFHGQKLILILESILQTLFSPLYFGPSIFLVAQKSNFIDE